MEIQAYGKKLKHLQWYVMMPQIEWTRIKKGKQHKSDQIVPSFLFSLSPRHFQELWSKIKCTAFFQGIQHVFIFWHTHTHTNIYHNRYINYECIYKIIYTKQFYMSHGYPPYKYIHTIYIKRVIFTNHSRYHFTGQYSNILKIIYCNENG